MSRGARILHIDTNPTYQKEPLWYRHFRHMMGSPLNDVNPPEKALSPDVYAGSCWKMQGDQGTLAISLSEAILMTSVVVEHASADILLRDIRHAPKEIEVCGLVGPNREEALLGKGVFGPVESNGMQKIYMEKPMSVRTVFIKVKSNWGSPEYTEIYRIRVHGTPSDRR